jgi:hypothetical protein
LAASAEAEAVSDDKTRVAQVSDEILDHVRQKQGICGRIAYLNRDGPAGTKVRAGMTKTKAHIGTTEQAAEKSEKQIPRGLKPPS